MTADNARTPAGMMTTPSAATTSISSTPLQVLQALTDTALTHLGLEELLRESLRRLHEGWPVDHAAILLLTEDGQELTLHTVHGPEAAVAQEVRIPVGQGIAGRIAAEKAPLIIDDLSQVEVTNLALHEQFRSLVGAPLLVQDRVLGVLHLATVRPRHFTQEDAHLLEQIASRLALAIDHARLYQAAREAAERASHLQATFDAITDSLLVLDAEGRIVGGNATFRAQVERGYPAGYSALTLPERVRHTPLFNEQGQSLTLEEWPQSRVLAGEVLTGADVKMPTSDGSELHLNVSGAPIRDAQGHITGAVLLYRDMTEQRKLARRTQEALEAVLAMAEALVTGPDAPDTSQEGPTREAKSVARQLADLTCRVLGCHRVGISLLDTKTDLLRPLAVAGLSPEQETKWWVEQEQQQAPLHASPEPAIVAQLETGKVMQFDLSQPPYQDLPNPYGITTMLVVPMRLEERLLGLLSLDHSGEAHIYTPDEQRLAQAVGELVALVVERERLLRERAEAEARALALQEANQRLETFISIVSHELRTPVTSIKANLQLVLRRVRQAREAPDVVDRLVQPLELLGRMEQQMRRLTRLLDDVIDLARIRTGKLDIAAAPCDLKMLLTNGVRAEQASNSSRIIHIEPLPNEEVPVLADPDRIEQVISNYLTNALKYSPAHETVAVGLTLEEGQARVWVRDQGPGILVEEQPRIWELFHRVSGIQVQSGSGVGLGLGLHISKTLVERQGGQVGVESTPGVGSTFWFTLPLARRSV